MVPWGNGGERGEGVKFLFLGSGWGGESVFGLSYSK
jgi:hypothetical protein